MKKFLSLLLAALLLLTTLPALAEGIPLYDVYPVNAGAIWFEVPMQYDVFDVQGSFTILGITDSAAAGSEAYTTIFAHIPEGLKLQRGDMDVTGFAQEGRAVMSGTENTGSSRVIERYTVDDLPAARVEMLGQGYEMIWIQDGGDLYFFMYPTADKSFAADMQGIASTLHLTQANTPARSDPADYEYTVDEAGVTITKYVGKAVRVAIPEEIDGKPVVALGDKAFYETPVTWVSIPDSVTELGRFCFGGCTHLQTLRLPATITHMPDGLLESCLRLYAVEIPAGVVSIGDYAFWSNDYLTELVLPASLAEIGGFNFVSLMNLTSFTLAEGNTAFKTLDGGKVLLTADGKRFIHYCAWQERSIYTIPEGVEVISAFAFGQQGSLRSVVVPEGVTTIEGTAFISVTGLQSLTLPGSVTDIGAARVTLTDGVLLPDPDVKPEDIPILTLPIVSDAVIIAPEGSAAQAHAEQFNLIFEAAPAADEIKQE